MWVTGEGIGGAGEGTEKKKTIKKQLKERKVENPCSMWFPRDGKQAEGNLSEVMVAYMTMGIVSQACLHVTSTKLHLK